MKFHTSLFFCLVFVTANLLSPYLGTLMHPDGERLVAIILLLSQVQIIGVIGAKQTLEAVSLASSLATTFLLASVLAFSLTSGIAIAYGEELPNHSPYVVRTTFLGVIFVYAYSTTAILALGTESVFVRRDRTRRLTYGITEMVSTVTILCLTLVVWTKTMGDPLPGDQTGMDFFPIPGTESFIWWGLLPLAWPVVVSAPMYLAIKKERKWLVIFCFLLALPFSFLQSSFLGYLGAGIYYPSSHIMGLLINLVAQFVAGIALRFQIKSDA